jgi:hypothetical protein
MKQMKKRCYFLIFIVSMTCTPKQDKTPVPSEKIIFDTDMGSDCDDAGALALLHAYADMGKAEILACVYSSGKVPYGAGIVQAINIYYGRPNIPVGAYHGDDIGDPVDKMSAEKLAKDTAAFGNTIIHNRDAEEQTRLTRRLLASQADSSVTYITVGHTRGLYDLLVSGPDSLSDLSGSDLIKKKIKRWITLGALGASEKDGQFRKDWNFFFNGTAPYTQFLVENFPSAVFYIDAGSEVMTGGSLSHTPPGNIVRTAYRDWLWWHEKRTLDDQRPSWDLTAVYFTIEGPGDFLQSEGNGWLEFDVERGCRWHAEKKYPVQTLISSRPQVNEAFADYMNGLIAKPPKR